MMAPDQSKLTGRTRYRRTRFRGLMVLQVEFSHPDNKPRIQGMGYQPHAMVASWRDAVWAEAHAVQALDAVRDAHAAALLMQVAAGII